MRFKIELDIETNRPKSAILEKTEKNITFQITDHCTVMQIIESSLKREGFNILKSEIETLEVA